MIPAWFAWGVMCPIAMVVGSMVTAWVLKDRT
jgi:hypothetical protein